MYIICYLFYILNCALNLLIYFFTYLFTNLVVYFYLFIYFALLSSFFKYKSSYSHMQSCFCSSGRTMVFSILMGIFITFPLSMNGEPPLINIELVLNLPTKPHGTSSAISCLPARLSIFGFIYLVDIGFHRHFLVIMLTFDYYLHPPNHCYY
jgi:hypothetical protein